MEQALHDDDGPAYAFGAAEEADPPPAVEATPERPALAAGAVAERLAPVRAPEPAPASVPAPEPAPAPELLPPARPTLVEPPENWDGVTRPGPAAARPAS